MAANESREEIKTYIKKYLSSELLLKHNDKRINKEELEKTIDVRAEQLLKEFEKDFLIHEVKQIVINDCKDALLRPTKFKRIAEPSTFIISILVSFLFASLVWFTDSPSYIKVMMYTCLGLSFTQVILYMTLKETT